MVFSPWRVFAGLLSLGLAAYLVRPLPLVSHPEPAPYVQEIEGHLNEGFLSLFAFLQTHDARYFDRAKVEAQVTASLSGRLKAAMEGTWPTLAIKFRRAQENERRVLTTLLEAENSQFEGRKALAKEKSDLLDLLQVQLLPITAVSARNIDRMNGLWVAIAAVQGLANDGVAPDISQESAFFRQSLLKYRRGALPRQTRLVDLAFHQWDRYLADAEKLAITDAAKKETLQSFLQAKTALERVLTDCRHLSPPSTPARAKLLELFSPRATDVYSFSFFAVALWLIWPIFRLRRSYMYSVQCMVEGVEAAATGDLSRVPTVPVGTGLERLAAGFIRLSAVLTRSENLVYHLAALVEASGDAIISQNLDGKIFSWNKGAQRLYGYSVEEVRGHSIEILSPMDQGYHIRKILNTVKTGAKIAPFETVHQAKNGRTVCALVRVSAIYDSLRQVIGVSFCAQELTPNSKASAAPLNDSFQRS